MKRHEYLKSAILAFVGALIFLIAGIIIQLKFTNPMISDDNLPIENLLLKVIPLILYIFAALFFISAAYATANEVMLEKGEDIFAKVTGVKEYLVGKGNNNIHYNVFCEWRDPKTKKLYKYRAKNLPTDPSPQLSDGKIIVRINKKDPRQYYIEL